MPWTAEKHCRAGENAEAQRQFDHAAHEFFQAAKKYARQGSKLQAAEMIDRQRTALAGLISLAESALDYETQALQWTTAACSRESADARAELYDLAADLFEEAADRCVALAGPIPGGAEKRDQLRKAVSHLEQAVANLLEGQALAACPWREEAIQDLQSKMNRLQWEAARRDLFADANPAGSSQPFPFEASSPDGQEASATRLLFAWLAKIGRTRCRQCDRLWKGYSSAAHEHALAQSEELSGAGKTSVRLLADQKWQALRNVLSHEAERHESTRISSGSMVSKTRAS